MKDKIKKELYEEDLKELLETNYNDDPLSYDILYYKLPLKEIISGKLFVHIYRPHPMKGIMVMIGSSAKLHGHVTCGFKSYSDIRKIFVDPDDNAEVTTCDGGEFSIVQAMKNFDVLGTTYFTYDSSVDSPLGFTWHLGIYGKHRKSLKALARKVVKFCDDHVDE